MISIPHTAQHTPPWFNFINIFSDCKHQININYNKDVLLDLYTWFRIQFIHKWCICGMEVINVLTKDTKFTYKVQFEQNYMIRSMQILTLRDEDNPDRRRLGLVLRVRNILTRWNYLRRTTYSSLYPASIFPLSFSFNFCFIF